MNGRFGGGGEDSSGGIQQGRGSRRYGAERDMLNASRSYGEGSQDVRGAPIHRHQEAAMSSRREWMGGGASSRGGEFDSRPGSSSGDSMTLNENVGRPFSHREGGTGGKREYHSGKGAEGSSAAAGPGRRRDHHDPISSLVESDSAGALWKAKQSQVPQLVQELEEKLTRGTVECMICYDMVGRGSPVWSCASCYAIFHLSCIRKWARAPTSADLSVSSSSNSLDGNWRCPGCQTVEFISAKDLRYYCFCGQVENPSVDHYITPHSCGGPCKKALDKSKVKRCNHYCTMRCHAGPCPPCAANAPSESCPCGKKTFTRRCGEQTAIGSCGHVCGRRLLCGRHSCSRICHEGPCDSCNVEVKTQCFCGVKQEILLCGRVEIQGELDFEKGLFSCASPCSRILSCGNHKCEEKCHPGQCGECELAPSKLETCPCGKKKLQELVANGRGRKSCLDAVPTCSQGCGKLLPCALHLCRDLCHAGPCPPCKVPVEQKCRCGSTSRSVACYVSQGAEVVGDENVGVFLCEKKCGQKKSCGRHRCNNRCCPAVGDGNHRPQDEQEHGPHECLLSCGKKLRCKQHYCQDLCHSGHCAPCLESTFTELSCACGKTSIPPPVPCGTPLPSCQHPCSFTQACGHSPTHLCHFGDCPPCTVQVSKECVGNHVLLRGVPCGSRDIKCNNLCGKTRQCGLHACGRACHIGPCDSAVEEDQGGLPKAAKLSCGQQCGAPRRDCSHKCSSTCHPLSLCPDNRCKVMVKITCGCGRISGEVPCDAGGGSHSRATAETEMLLSRLPAPLQPINGNEKIPLGQRKIQCDDECGKLEKRRLLADAFGVDYHGDAHLGGDNGILGSDILAEMLRRDPQWVLSVEERFKTLLLGPKGSGGIKVHVFCAMSKEKRDIIFQLAERWSLSVSNSGREPQRFPIVHVTNKSKVPYLKLISKTPLPTAGQQIPPPFNPAVDMEPGRVVAFFDVPREVDMSSLVLRFAGECELVWLNDKNALAIFGDAARAATALRRVDHTSAYKGAISLPGSAIHSSSRVGGAWGQAVGGTYAAAKPATRKKAVQLHESSPWVDDAWGEAGKEGAGAWQSKGSNLITTTKNPWGALEQIKPSVNAEGIKGCFVSGQSSSLVPAKEGESSAQGERGKHIRPPTTADADKQVGTSKAVSQLGALSLSKNATTSSISNAAAAATASSNDDDDWERLLD
ncbi:unnamed protein product [Calypogeia fissa]